LRLLIQGRPDAKKRKDDKKGYVTFGCASIDLSEIVRLKFARRRESADDVRCAQLQLPLNGLVTVFRVTSTKRSVRDRLRGTSSAPSSAQAAKELADADAMPAGGDDSDDETIGVMPSTPVLDGAHAIADASITSPAVLHGGSKSEQLGAPLARVWANVASVAIGSDVPDEPHDADRIGGVSDDDAGVDNDAGNEPSQLDDLDLPASVRGGSLAERIGMRVVEHAIKEKQPGKFRKWATKLRKRGPKDIVENVRDHDFRACL
jgi:hypothetical protein